MSGAGSNEKRRANDCLGWIVIPGMWLILYAMGQPFPIADDIWYVGAAFNLSEGKGLANPYCPALAAIGGLDHYYSYGPLYSYVLAGWIDVFGRTRETLAVFQCLAGTCASLGLWRLLRDEFTDILLPGALSLAVATLLCGAGLRPDALGLALLAWGSLLVRFKGVFIWGICSLCLFLAVITSPNHFILLPILFLAAFYFQLWVKQAAGREYMIRGAIVLFCGATVFLLFLYLIDFHLGEFLTVLNKNREKSAPYALLGNLKHFGDLHTTIRVLAQAVEPFLIMLGGASLVCFYPGWFYQRISPVLAVAVVLAGICLFVPAMISAGGMRVPALYAVLVFLFFVSRLKLPQRYGGYLVWCGSYVFFLLAIGHFLIYSMFIRTAMAPSAEVIQSRVAALNPTHIYFDEFALDAFYHYHPPANATDYHQSLPIFWPNSRPSDFPRDSLLIISRQATFFMAAEKETGRFEPNHHRLLTFVFPWMVDDPFALELIYIDPNGGIHWQLPNGESGESKPHS